MGGGQLEKKAEDEREGRRKEGKQKRREEGRN